MRLVAVPALAHLGVVDVARRVPRAVRTVVAARDTDAAGRVVIRDLDSPQAVRPGRSGEGDGEHGEKERDGQHSGLEGGSLRGIHRVSPFRKKVLQKIGCVPATLARWRLYCGHARPTAKSPDSGSLVALAAFASA